MTAAAAVELLPEPLRGRVFRERRTVRLGDVDRLGRLRLDATARYLQDIATHDASDAGLDRRFGWLVRRTQIDVGVAAGLGEPVDVATWCTGIGRSWAERRSSIVGERGARIDAVALWVQVDVTSGRPSRVGDDFHAAYAVAADGRSVSSRLSIPSPTSTDDTRPWSVRRTDIDPFGHVNNAATWEFLEEFAALDEADRREGRAEMEYLQPVVYGSATDVVVEPVPGTGLDAWLVVDATVRSAARWRPSMT